MLKRLFNYISEKDVSFLCDELKKELKNMRNKKNLEKWNDLFKFNERKECLNPPIMDKKIQNSISWVKNIKSEKEKENDTEGENYIEDNFKFKSLNKHKIINQPSRKNKKESSETVTSTKAKTKKNKKHKATQHVRNSRKQINRRNVLEESEIKEIEELLKSSKVQSIPSTSRNEQSQISTENSGSHNSPNSNSSNQHQQRIGNSHYNYLHQQQQQQQQQPQFISNPYSQHMSHYPFMNNINSYNGYMGQLTPNNHNNNHLNQPNQSLNLRQENNSGTAPTSDSTSNSASNTQSPKKQRANTEESQSSTNQRQVPNVNHFNQQFFAQPQQFGHFQPQMNPMNMGMGFPPVQHNLVHPHPHLFNVVPTGGPIHQRSLVNVINHNYIVQAFFVKNQRDENNLNGNTGNLNGSNLYSY